MAKHPAKRHRYAENEVPGRDFDISAVDISDVDDSLSDERNLLDESSSGFVKGWETIQIHWSRRARPPRE